MWATSSKTGASSHALAKARPHADAVRSTASREESRCGTASRVSMLKQDYLPPARVSIERGAALEGCERGRLAGLKPCARVGTVSVETCHERLVTGNTSRYWARGSRLASHSVSVRVCFSRSSMQLSMRSIVWSSARAAAGNWCAAKNDMMSSRV